MDYEAVQDVKVEKTEKPVVVLATWWPIGHEKNEGLPITEQEVREVGVEYFVNNEGQIDLTLYIREPNEDGHLQTVIVQGEALDAVINEFNALQAHMKGT